MTLTYQVVNLFSSPRGHLVEIKHLDQMTDTAHEWLWVTDQSVTTLRSRHGDGETQQVRMFRDACLQLDGQRAELAWANGEQLSLTPRPRQELRAEQHQLIHNHLS